MKEALGFLMVLSLLIAFLWAGSPQKQIKSASEPLKRSHSVQFDAFRGNQKGNWGRRFAGEQEIQKSQTSRVLVEPLAPAADTPSESAPKFGKPKTSHSNRWIVEELPRKPRQNSGFKVESIQERRK